MNKIISFSIKNKLIVLLGTIGLIIWGVYSLKNLPLDAVPDITNNQVQVITVCPSLSAIDIERQITAELEKTCSTIPHKLEMRSFSRQGLSVVTLVFEDHVDVYWARQQVGEAIKVAQNNIPSNYGTPEMTPVSTGLGEIYQYIIKPLPGFEKQYDAMELRTMQDWIVRKQLMGTEGVADISSFGGLLKQYEIQINPDKLKSMGVRVDEIMTALEKSNKNTGGAYIEKNSQAYYIRTEALFENLDQIKNVVIRPGKTPILLNNVAEVKIGSAIRYGALTNNDQGEVVGGIVLMLKGANSAETIDGVKAKIAKIQESLPKGVLIEPYLDRTKLINKTVGTIAQNLTEGALIVIFVLLLVLGNIRAGLLVASVIPLAMLFAIAMMYLLGISGNLMSLGAIDFGLIVDGTVIIIESILHHLSMRRLNPHPLTPSPKVEGEQRNFSLTQHEMDEEVETNSIRMTSSAAMGQIVILIVYFPLLTLQGVEGKMFQPMAQTVALAILGAFMLSLTYVPAMASIFLSKKNEGNLKISDKIVDFFYSMYRPVFDKVLIYRKLTTSFSIFILLISFFIFSTLGGEFIPSLDEGDLAVETRLMPGSSLDHTVNVTKDLAKIILKEFQEVRQVVGKIGTAEIPTDPMPMEACDLMVLLKEENEWTTGRTKKEFLDTLEKVLKRYPGVNYSIQQPIEMRFNELMTGAKQDVVIKINGHKFESLIQLADTISKSIAGIEGVKDLYVEPLEGQPQIIIKPDDKLMARYGIHSEDINFEINSSYAGLEIGNVFEEDKKFSLIVKLDRMERNSIEEIAQTPIPCDDGTFVPLEQVAKVDLQTLPTQIQRDNGTRRILVAFNQGDRDVESIVADVEKQMKKIKFPTGYSYQIGGSFENLKQAKARLGIAVPLSLFLIAILLFFNFNSVTNALLILTAVPFSAIGGIFGLVLRGMPFSISAGIGFIALFGVAVLNGIVLVAAFNELRSKGYSGNLLLIEGTLQRFRPVLMTAMVASLGFLPMALSSSAGAEVQKPLATVVIGGLISSTLLTLILLPIFYAWFNKTDQKVEIEENEYNSKS